MAGVYSLLLEHYEFLSKQVEKWESAVDNEEYSKMEKSLQVKSIYLCVAEVTRLCKYANIMYNMGQGERIGVSKRKYKKLRSKLEDKIHNIGELAEKYGKEYSDKEKTDKKSYFI